ncbi:MAG: PhoH family protein [Candidatus Marinimicrobia bacterium]|nr:PhoH family protein [Candidatus Neomarinimicrobiota bacterium]
MAKDKKKLFVIDTNVILHDSSCISNFEEHDVAIPITVLEEMDVFKRGNEMVNFHARDFLRTLDKLTGDVWVEDGVSLGEEKGKIRIHVDHENNSPLKSIFHENIPDHRILFSTYNLSKKITDRDVILVTKDTNLRMKAKSVGLIAQDYTTDKVESIDKIYTGLKLIEDLPSETIDAIYKKPFYLEADKIPQIENPVPNQNFILRNSQKSALVTYNPFEEHFKRVDKKPAYGIVPRNAEQSFALQALLDPKIPLISITGKAGTGKTILALAGALQNRQNYRQIMLARPIVPLSNRDIGYLPGDIESKINPYMQPLFDNLAVIKHQFKQNDENFQRVNEMLDTEKLVITPLAYIRGRSYQKVYFIVDEAQNLTPHEIKTIITRAGEGTKFVFTGDIYQIDQPYLDSLSNGLTYLINRMVGQSIFAHITLKKGERSALAELASNLL